jgi:hypothetical protein
MSERTIQINPALFSINSAKTTRKNRKPAADSPKIPPIKVKNPTNKNKNASSLKRNLLKMFRNQYEEKYKEKDGQARRDVLEKKPLLYVAPKTDFEDSLEYLQGLSETTTPPQKPATTTLQQTFLQKNHTMKNYTTTSLPYENRVNLPPTFIMNNQPPPGNNLVLKPPQHQVPQYGCLKNGNLPTYKTWKHSTQRNHNHNIPKPSSESIVQQNIPADRFDKHMQNQLEELSLRDQRHKINMGNNKPPQQQQKQKQQRRICRRTFHVGKSKQHPRISVLVSNKTIRNNTNLKLSKLKNTPMPEVRKYLLKNGFIKSGSNTPTDVLRQMFESASLICGEVKNRNPENLLYNYFNETEYTSV